MPNTDLPDVLIHIDETLDHERLKDIEIALRLEAGVVTVGYQDDRPHVMMVQYDPEEIRATRILEKVKDQGVHAELVGL